MNNERRLADKQVLLEMPTDDSLLAWLDLLPQAFPNLSFQLITSESAFRIVSRARNTQYGLASRTSIRPLGFRDLPISLFSRQTKRSFIRLDEFVSRLRLPSVPYADVTVVSRTKSRQTNKLDRRIPNLDELSSHLDESGFTFRIIDFADEAPLRTIALVRQSSYLMGQHGAGLTHLIWLKPGEGSLIEIRGPKSEMPFLAWVYEHLAQARGVSFRAVQAQDSWIGNLSMNEVLGCLSLSVGPPKKKLEFQLEKAKHFAEFVTRGLKLISRQPHS